jgi:class 3 adenylate cyclase
MESHGEAGSIHCTDEVCKALGDTFVFEERGEIEVKGKGRDADVVFNGDTAACVRLCE